MLGMDYTVLLTREDDGQYSASVPDLPNVFATGDTAAEATAHAKEAIELLLEVMREEGQPVPAPKTSAVVCSVAA